MRIKLLYIGILALTLSACSGYQKLLKSSDNSLKYRRAFEYYAIEDYVRAGELFDQIANVYRGSTKADTVSYYQAMSYYKQKDYIMAGHYFKTFSETYPYSPFAEETEYLSAYCYYKDSPKPSLDQESTMSAIEAFNTFVNKYPDSQYTLKAKEYTVELQDKLVDKSRNTAILYYNLGNYKSAIVALTNSLQEYPNTKYREELMWRLVESNFKLADNSIPSKQKDRFQSTIDEYYSFISEYPQSEYKKDAEKIYEYSAKRIK